jgi:hypothetical protein
MQGIKSSINQLPVQSLHQQQYWLLNNKKSNILWLMSISKKKSASKYTVLNISQYHWVWKVFFHFSLLPLNFHVHTGWRGGGGWAVACFCGNFHEIRKLRNYTALSFSENMYSFTTDTHTLKKQIAKSGTNLTSKLCPVRREKTARHTVRNGEEHTSAIHSRQRIQWHRTEV